MTTTIWLDIVVILASFVAGGLINWLLRPEKLGNAVLIMLICVAVAVVLVLTVIKDQTGNEQHNPQIEAVACPRLFDKAHDKLTAESTEAPPPAPSTSFTPSQDFSGRIDLTVSWINQVPVTQSAIAMQGVYGQADPGDYFIDHQEPAAATGQCWNWYHYAPRNDTQPQVVHFRVNALWPEQTYCFYTVFRTAPGYSKPSAIRCEKAAWKREWGSPTPVPKDLTPPRTTK